MADLPKTKRAELLSKIRAGHDLASACVALDISEGQIEAGGDNLKAQIARAYKTSTSRLRGKIMEGALTSDNTAVLMKLLEQRQAAQDVMVAEAADGPMARADFAKRMLFLLAEALHDPLEKARWMSMICQFRCEHCGRPPYAPEPTGTSPVTDFPERRSNSHLK